MSVAAFRALLERGDVDGLRAAWSQIAPHLPQPASREQAEIVMHRARTEAATVNFRARAYSHRWLIERDLPSGLPDELKPNAEQVCPTFAQAVGISVNVRNEYLKPVAAEVEKAMAYAVEDAFADNRKDPAFVSQRMQEAKDRTFRALIGNSAAPFGQDRKGLI